jgi:hypothetical protein
MLRNSREPWNHSSRKFQRNISLSFDKYKYLLHRTHHAKPGISKYSLNVIEQGLFTSEWWWHLSLKLCTASCTMESLITRHHPITSSPRGRISCQIIQQYDQKPKFQTRPTSKVEDISGWCVSRSWDKISYADELQWLAIRWWEWKQRLPEYLEFVNTFTVIRPNLQVPPDSLLIPGEGWEDILSISVGRYRV